MNRYKTRGEAIKDLRTKKGLTQEELAVKIGITKQAIYKYENNIVKEIPPKKAEELARIFDVHPSVIMGWEDKTHWSTVADDYIDFADLVSSGMSTDDAFDEVNRRIEHYGKKVMQLDYKQRDIVEDMIDALLKKEDD